MGAVGASLSWCRLTLLTCVALAGNALADETLYVADPDMAAIYGRDLADGPGRPYLVSGALGVSFSSIDVYNEREAITVSPDGQLLLYWNLETGATEQIAHVVEFWDDGSSAPFNPYFITFDLVDVAPDGLSFVTKLGGYRAARFVRADMSMPWSESVAEVPNWLYLEPPGKDADLIHFGSHAAYLSGDPLNASSNSVQILDFGDRYAPSPFLPYQNVIRIARVSDHLLGVATATSSTHRYFLVDVSTQAEVGRGALHPDFFRFGINRLGHAFDFENRPDGLYSAVTNTNLSIFSEPTFPSFPIPGPRFLEEVFTFRDDQGKVQVRRDLSAARELFRASETEWLVGIPTLNLLARVDSDSDFLKPVYSIQRGQGPAFEDILDLQTLPNGELLVLDEDLIGIRLLRVNPTTGNRSLFMYLTGEDAPEFLGEIRNVYPQMEVDAQGRVVFLFRRSPHHDRELFAGALTLDGEPTLELLAGGNAPCAPIELALDAQGLPMALCPGSAGEPLLTAAPDGGWQGDQNVTLHDIDVLYEPADYPSRSLPNIKMLVPQEELGDELVLGFVYENPVLLDPLNTRGIVVLLVPPLAGDPVVEVPLLRVRQMPIGFEGAKVFRETAAGETARIPISQLPGGKLTPGTWTAKIRRKSPDGSYGPLQLYQVADPDTVQVIIRSLRRADHVVKQPSGTLDFVASFPPRITTEAFDGTPLRTVELQYVGGEGTEHLNLLADVIPFGTQTTSLFAAEEDRPVVWHIIPESGAANPFLWGRPTEVDPLVDTTPRASRLQLAIGDSATPVLVGDVNGDGYVTPGDAQAAFLCFLRGGEGCPEADACPNGAVTPADAQTIFRTYLGLVPDCP